MAAFQSKLDLRFADEEDAEEIALLVNSTARTEGEGEWRLPGDKISAEEVARDCESMKTRWIVLETPVPEEAVVAAVRLCLLINEKKGVIDIMCAAGEENVVYNQLLARIEGIVRGMAVEHLVIEVVQWNEGMFSWLTSCGYTDIAGRECKDENLLKPTLVLDMHKDLTINRSSHESAVTAEPLALPDSLSDLLDSIEISDVTSQSDTGRQDGSMEGLIGNLFAALHREYGEA